MMGEQKNQSKILTQGKFLKAIHQKSMNGKLYFLEKTKKQV